MSWTVTSPSPDDDLAMLAIVAIVALMLFLVGLLWIS